MGRKIGKSAIEVMRERFPANASEIETYADAFDVLAEKIAPLEVAATISENEAEKTVMTLNKTAAELFDAAAAGKLVKLSATISIPVEGGETTTGTMTMIIPVEIFKVEVLGNIVYSVKMRMDADKTDALYFGGDFAGTDSVVLTEQ